MKIKVKLFNPKCKFESIKKGEWIDLKSADYYVTEAPIAKRARKDAERDVIFKHHMIPLGIGMKLPEGYEAIIVPRSSTFKSYGILQVNNVGVIDGK